MPLGKSALEEASNLLLGFVEKVATVLRKQDVGRYVISSFATVNSMRTLEPRLGRALTFQDRDVVAGRHLVCHR